MIFFTADEHYGHRNIIDYCDRPFEDVEEMDTEIIKRHNEVVCSGDTVIHAGDFCLSHSSVKVESYIGQLNGKQHIFLRGSHDYWLANDAPYLWERKVQGVRIVVCHYAMRRWRWSHYNSWQLFGHSHGALKPMGKQWDIGVDNNDFRPLSITQLKRIMADRPDNENYLK